jgi:glycosyltransferase involved in cell wall biosynthesis
VLFCGNLRRAKGADLLIPLANELGGRYEIRYTGGLRQGDALPGTLRAGAAVLKNLGQVRHAEMPAVYRETDILFMPSVREGFGLCAAEAMACGLPVVGCDSSALAELVVNGQGGVLCGTGKLDCYVNAITSVAEDPGAAPEMGAFNRSRVEQHFTLERMIREYRDLFTELVDEDRAVR